MTNPMIVIVSRDEDARIIFGTALSCAGYRVRQVADPDAVLEIVQDCDPSLVVTNYPTLLRDGRTVTQALRALDATARIPIVNATSHVIPDELARATSAGVDVSLPLPLAPARLVTVVQELLRSPATRTGGCGGAMPA